MIALGDILTVMLLVLKDEEGTTSTDLNGHRGAGGRTMKRTEQCKVCHSRRRLR